MSARGVVKSFDVRGGVFGRVVGAVQAVDHVDLDVFPGRFHPRCPIAATGVCDVEAPVLLPAGDDPGHLAECHLQTSAYQDLDPGRAPQPS